MAHVMIRFTKDQVYRALLAGQRALVGRLNVHDTMRESSTVEITVAILKSIGIVPEDSTEEFLEGDRHDVDCPEFERFTSDEVQSAYDAAEKTYRVFERQDHSTPVQMNHTLLTKLIVSALTALDTYKRATPRLEFITKLEKMCRIAEKVYGESTKGVYPIDSAALKLAIRTVLVQCDIEPDELVGVTS
jgi:hypothetical protein